MYRQYDSQQDKLGLMPKVMDEFNRSGGGSSGGGGGGGSRGTPFTKGGPAPAPKQNGSSTISNGTCVTAYSAAGATLGTALGGSSPGAAVAGAAIGSVVGQAIGEKFCPK